MNEFDLRKFLYNNPLMEKKEDSKKGNKEEQKRLEGAIRDDRDHKFNIDKDEDEQRKKLAKLKKDAKKETGKGKKGNEDEQKRAEGAIKDAKDHKKKLDGDIKANEKKLKKLKKDFKDDVNEGMYNTYEEDDMKEEMDSKYEEDDMKEGMGKYYEDDEGKGRKMTKEGLKSMIRERITSILNEQEDDEVDVDVQNKVDVKDKNETDVDIEKEKEVDDVSKETDIDVKTSLPGESEDVDAVLGLLTKASEEADRFSDDPELKTQIGNTITYFTRKHIAGPTNEGEEVNEKFLGLMSDVEKGQRLGIGTDKGGLGFTKIGRGVYKLTDPTSHPSFRQGEIWKPKQDEKTLKVGQSLPRLGDIEGLMVGRESKDKVKT